MTENYRGCYEYLSAQYPEVGGYEFYKELFPDNENSGERHTDFSHPNAVYLYRDEQSEDKKLRRRKMYNDTWEQDYMEFVEGNSLTLCSGLAYRRKENRLENAQRMYALIFDLDGVGLAELRNLFLRFGGDPERVRRLPMPTFLVLSGTGLHIYYVFQQPIDLYPNIKIQLKSLKYDLTFRLWEYGSTSQVKAIQYQSINQSFRMVGSINDKHGTELVAFRTGERVTLDYLNAYAKPENRVDVNKPFSPSKMTRAEAREAYPEWYERVVVRGEKGRKKWDIAGKVHGDDPYALYHWWLRQIGEIKGGHRYFFLMCLAIYAYKCGVSKQQLRQDMKEAFDDLQMVKHENALTEEDIRSALEAYDKEYYNFTISDIEALTDVRIERNKRNGRSQKEHLKRARAVQEVDYPGGTWRRKGAEAKKELKKLIDKYDISLISVGNGTASRESEQVIVDMLKEIPEKKVQYVITNEAGASVYSASKLATEEFPNFDVGQRSAASIARRLQDPLAFFSSSIHNLRRQILTALGLMSTPKRQFSMILRFSLKRVS